MFFKCFIFFVSFSVRVTIIMLLNEQEIKRILVEKGILCQKSVKKNGIIWLTFCAALGYNTFCCGYGGIGRRARFRFWWETVQVQVLLPAR